MSVEMQSGNSGQWDFSFTNEFDFQILPIACWIEDDISGGSRHMYSGPGFK